MRRARSVTGPLRRAHPASGATWNVQVVRGKMSTQCLWHACRALSAGLLLMLLGAAMAVIGYYADFLSVDQEIRGNATVSVKDEARGFHLNNLSYVGPIVMGFGGFIVVAACVMTFEARDSAAKVTPARPTALPRPLPRRGPACAAPAPARLDQLGVYRLPHVLPLPHSLPLVPMALHRHRPVLASASAAESECGSQSSLALDLHASGACAGVTLRVRDNTRRRPLARQQRLRDDTHLVTPKGSTSNVNNAEQEALKTPGEESNATIDMTHLSVESELRSSSAPPPTRSSVQPSPLPSPQLPVINPLKPEHSDTCITIEPTEQRIQKPNKEEMEKQTDAARDIMEEKLNILPQVILNMNMEDLLALHENRDRIVDEEIERQIELQIMATMAQLEDISADAVDGNAAAGQQQETGAVNYVYEDNAAAAARVIYERRLSEQVEVTGYPSLYDLNTRDEFSLERLQEELDIDIISRLSFQEYYEPEYVNTEQAVEELDEEVTDKQTETMGETQNPPPDGI